MSYLYGVALSSISTSFPLFGKDFESEREAKEELLRRHSRKETKRPGNGGNRTALCIAWRRAARASAHCTYLPLRRCVCCRCRLHWTQSDASDGFWIALKLALGRWR